jgi:hypothetical protein
MVKMGMMMVKMKETGKIAMTQMKALLQRRGLQRVQLRKTRTVRSGMTRRIH